MKSPAQARPRGSALTPARPRRTPSPVIKACLEDLRQAQSHLAAAASRLRGVATSVEALAPDLAKDLTDEHVYAQVLAGLLDAHVRDLADPRRGVR